MSLYYYSMLCVIRMDFKMLYDIFKILILERFFFIFNRLMLYLKDISQKKRGKSNIMTDFLSVPFRKLTHFSLIFLY